MHGPGRLISYVKNYVIEGNFKEGKAHGYCKKIKSDEIYEGYFESDEEQGYGT